METTPYVEVHEKTRCIFAKSYHSSFLRTRLVLPIFQFEHMPTTCQGCQQTFRGRGLKNHIRNSKDPRCKRAVLSRIPRPTVEASTENHIVVDPTGDIFGNYADYSSQDFGIQDNIPSTSKTMESEGVEDVGDETGAGGNEEDLNADELDGANGEEEHGLEPERPDGLGTTGTAADDEEEDPDLQTPLRMRGGHAERLLSKKPFVVKFPNRNAGRVHHHDTITTNDAYRKDLGGENPDNIYAPFTSQIDWEIGRWVKLRGPSSTAFTELMKIDGVSRSNSFY